MIILHVLCQVGAILEVILMTATMMITDTIIEEIEDTIIIINICYTILEKKEKMDNIMMVIFITI